MKLVLITFVVGSVQDDLLGRRSSNARTYTNGLCIPSFHLFAHSVFLHLLKIVSAIPSVLEGKGAIGVFSLSLVIMGIGTGGFKANISPLVAEQYKRTKIFVKTTHKGERVIVDPSLTTAKIYMYFYFFINIGALIGQISMAYAEKVRHCYASLRKRLILHL